MHVQVTVCCVVSLYRHEGGDVPGAYLQAFRDGVVAAARERHAGVPLRRIAAESGISESCLQNWLRQDAATRRGETMPSARAQAQFARRLRIRAQEDEVLRRTIAYHGTADDRAKIRPRMMYPLVRELADDGIPVALTCRILKIARQPYYRWVTRPVSDAAWLEAHRVDALLEAHRTDAAAGYRTLAESASEHGWPMAARTAWRLCHGNDVRSAARPSRPGHESAHHPAFERSDALPHELTASRPGALWLARLTEHATAQGKRHLCLIRDMFSRRVVGYAVSERMSASLAVSAIEDAVARVGDPFGCTLWSDKGSQFQSRAVSRALARHGLVPSAGRVGSDDDEEHAEAAQFFAVLQSHGLAPR